MKKFYAILTAALMSASLFAQTPTAANLSSYMEAGYYVACFSTPAATTCNDIVWIGTYCDWTVPADVNDLIQCTPLAGFDGWYVAKVPVHFKEDGTTPDNAGKPAQLSECNRFSWDYQCGAYGTIELVSGSVDIGSGMSGAETNLENWSTTEPTIVTMSAWKSSPCSKACSEKQYVIRLYDPFCESHPEFAPYIQGNYDNWSHHPAAMTMKTDAEGSSVYEYTTPMVGDNLSFKFNNSASDNWDNQFEYFNESEDKWMTFDDKNFTLAPVADNPNNAHYTRVVDTLTFDWWDKTKYRYAQCAPTESFTINLTAPAGAPETIEVIGSFNNWCNDPADVPVPMTKSGDIYTATVDVSPTAEFKFRALGNWDIQIQKYFEKDGVMDWHDMDNLKFGEEAVAGVIDLDFSNAELYRWSAPQGIENVVLTERAQKVVVDGVLYIVRDHKMYNVQGTQVR